MLWRIERVEPRRSRMDYRSSGRGQPEVTQLFADDELLASTLAPARWIGSSVQAIACTCCGIEGCESGGWVAPRGASGAVIWLPAFERMADPALGIGAHGPPSYVATRGLPFFDERRTVELAHAAPTLPPWWELPPLRSRELVLALQWTAPARLLGEPGAPVVLRSSDVLAVSSGDRHARAREVAALLESATADDEPLRLRPSSAAEEIITLYLDAAGHPAWSPLAIVAGVPRLVLDGLVALP